ncbi:hypothetical protein PA25_36950 [Pseudoalteromonas sp. A25]|uniref:cupin domain-containing protein n=1 Tax=Pseudoalteromonas sp. A25 TaxID=116092 RepID=UPI00126045DD|nr:cupin domain-containing protein [Pseudoalteromonas sp. A25]BBN83710.1 hypothetical protein PA25_36950 [Pseudoalteromonas sp. A25]
MRYKHLILGITSALLANSNAQAQEASVSFEVIAKSTKSWDGSLLPAYPRGQPQITMLKVTIPAGATVKKHKHPMINAAVMLSGELTVRSQRGEVLKLQAGDPIVELVDKWHEGKNEGNIPVELIVFYAAIEGQPLSIKHTD